MYKLTCIAVIYYIHDELYKNKIRKLLIKINRNRYSNMSFLSLETILYIPRVFTSIWKTPGLLWEAIEAFQVEYMYPNFRVLL